MRKFSNIMKMFALVPASLAIGSLPAMASESEPWVMEISEGNIWDHNQYFGNFIGQDGSGNVYVFDVELWMDWQTDPDTGYEHIVYNVGNITVRGVTAKDHQNFTSVSFPDKITVKYDNQTIEDNKITRAEFRIQDYENSFPWAENLKEFYFPEGLKNLKVYLNPEDDPKDLQFHMPSDVVTNIEISSMYATTSNRYTGWISFYVPDKYFLNYDEILYNKGYSSMIVSNSDAPLIPITINIATPGTLNDGLYEQGIALSSIRHLILTGTPDEEDILLLRRMTRLEKLDLSGVTGLTSVTRLNNLRFLNTIVLPDNLEEIGVMAFQNDVRLTNVEIPSTVKIINTEAFSGCDNIKSISLPEGLEEIGASAFRKSGLSEITFPSSLRVIGDCAFEYCDFTEIKLPDSVEEVKNGAFQNNKKLVKADLGDLEEVPYWMFAFDDKLVTIDLSNVKVVSREAFTECYALTEISLDNVERIEYGAFRYCNISQIKLPDSVTELQYYAFEYCYNLKHIELGRNLQYISENAFYGITPETVICPILFPLNSNGFHYANLNYATLYVPRVTLSNYMVHDAWMNFPYIEALDDELLTEVTVNQPFDLKTNYGVSNTPNITNESQFSISRDKALTINKYTHSYNDDFDPGYYWGNPVHATLINTTDVTANTVELKRMMPTNQWSFLSFPFDVKVGDIIVEGNDVSALWVVRKYSGLDRSKLNENTWQNMNDDTVLKAGEGYIFHCTDVKNNKYYLEFTFPAYNKGNEIFNNGDVDITLEQYPSEFAHNDSWNLIGNTYPAYVNIQGMDFDGPVTVWTGSTYTSYSTKDDDYVFSPFEAFFVQRQDWEGGDHFIIKPDSRSHTPEEASEWQPKATRAYFAPEQRTIFNLSINGSQGSDRTRLVINENAKFAYESNRDAAKFMSNVETMPQVYILNNNVKYSIDERPLSNGDAIIGVFIGENGRYSFSLDTKGEYIESAKLIDKVTGVTTDLLAASYEFNSEQGTYNDRFILNVKLDENGGLDGDGATSGIDGVEGGNSGIFVNGNQLNVNAEGEIIVITSDGKIAASSANGNLSATLPAGLYIVKTAKEAVKVMVGK